MGTWFIPKFDEKVIGDKDDNNITTGDGDDLIISGKGDDIILSGDGDDLIISGKGDDIIDAGAGDDVVRSGSGDDTVEAGLGNDIVFAGKDNDRVFGGEGDDLLIGGSGDDFLDGGAGDDLIIGGSGDDDLLGRDGHDILLDGSGNDFSNGGEGNDTLISKGGMDNLRGGQGDDLIISYDGMDVMLGHEGDDTLITRGNNGLLYAGSGTNTIELINENLSDSPDARHLLVVDDPGSDIVNDTIYGIENFQDTVVIMDIEGFSESNVSNNGVDTHVSVGNINLTFKEFANQDDILFYALDADNIVGDANSEVELQLEGVNLHLAEYHLVLVEPAAVIRLNGVVLQSESGGTKYIFNYSEGDVLTYESNNVGNDIVRIEARFSNEKYNELLVNRTFNIQVEDPIPDPPVVTLPQSDITITAVEDDSNQGTATVTVPFQVHFSGGAEWELVDLRLDITDEFVILNNLVFDQPDANGNGSATFDMNQNFSGAFGVKVLVTYRHDNGTPLDPADDLILFGESPFQDIAIIADADEPMTGNLTFTHSENDPLTFTIPASLGEDTDGSEELVIIFQNDPNQYVLKHQGVLVPIVDGFYQLNLGVVEHLTDFQFTVEAIDGLEDFITFAVLSKEQDGDTSGVKLTQELYIGSNNADVGAISSNSVTHILGFDGNDFLDILSSIEQEIYAHAGDDRIAVASSAAKTIYGGSGQDKLIGGDGDDVIYGGDGNHTDFGSLLNDDDFIAGGAGNDTIYGEGGDDRLDGNSGHDFIYGGDGNDQISGGDGNDILDGGAGNDIIHINSGRDLAYGMSGDDVIYAGNGDHTFLYGGTGNDTLYGGSGRNSLLGQEGNDTIYFDSLDEIVHGEDGLADTLHSLSSTSSLVRYREFIDTDVHQILHLSPNEDVVGGHELIISGVVPNFELVRVAAIGDTVQIIQNSSTNWNFTYSDNQFIVEVNGAPLDMTPEGDIDEIIVDILYDGLQRAELFNIQVNSHETTEVDLDFFL